MHGRFDEDHEFFASFGQIDADWIRSNCIRMGRYTKTTIDFFLSLSVQEFFDWQSCINTEIKADNKAVKDAARR